MISVSNLLLACLWCSPWQSAEDYKSMCTRHRQAQYDLICAKSAVKSQPTNRHQWCKVLLWYSYQPSISVTWETTPIDYMYFSSLFFVLHVLYWDECCCALWYWHFVSLVSCVWPADWRVFSLTVEWRWFMQSMMLAVVLVGLSSHVQFFFTSEYSFADIVKSEIVGCCKHCDLLFFNFYIFAHIFLSIQKFHFIFFTTLLHSELYQFYKGQYSIFPVSTHFIYVCVQQLCWRYEQCQTLLCDKCT